MTTQKQPPSPEEIRETAAAFEKKIGEMMEGPINFYNGKPGEAEMDLVGSVRQLLVDAGCGAVIEEAFDNSRFIIEAKGKVAHAQQFNLIRWAGLQLMSAEHSSPVTRYAMPYELNPEDWYKVFSQHVLPQMLSLGLPVKIG